MPEIVRQHTHFHKVYKLVEPHAPSHPPTKWQPQPHVSLLGYTTTASGTGHLTSDLAQLISSVVAATPTPPTPNYGPALFDNKYLTEESATNSDTTVQPAGKLLQQLFKPNVEVEPPPAPHADSEPELEHNELLNSNFMAALQREYLSKFGSTSKPPKRKKPNNNNNNSFLRVAKPKLKPKLKTKSKYKQQMEEYASNYLHDMQSGENFDEQTEEEEEQQPPPTAYAEHYQELEGIGSHPFDDEDEVVHDSHGDYDSATAFSTPNNGLSFLPTPDEFLNDIHSSNSYAGNTYSDLYDDDYGPSAAAPAGTGWKTVPASKLRSTKPSLTTNSKLLRHRQRRRPALDFMATGSSSSWAPTASATGSGHSGSGPHHMRYPKLTNRSKRKNRIKSKTYRI